eukprot:TRINITY_DN66986_c0_g1_i1.p1 TRINITY_DN66986_c0_g1~~TRINITY_DN66986_c0_g1_i1.p1  ORF type:complete len:184 (+),score=29.67 TRINITY_DN66986_c0_g1_i1:29-580(+)
MWKWFLAGTQASSPGAWQRGAQKLNKSERWWLQIGQRVFQWQRVHEERISHLDPPEYAHHGANKTRAPKRLPGREWLSRAGSEERQKKRRLVFANSKEIDAGRSPLAPGELPPLPWSSAYVPQGQVFWYHRHPTDVGDTTIVYAKNVPTQQELAAIRKRLSEDKGIQLEVEDPTLKLKAAAAK